MNLRSRHPHGNERDVVGEFRTRRLDEQPFPYVFADATYVRGRVNGRVVSRAVVIAFGVNASGTREVLDVDVGDSEDEVFWNGFLRGLRRRGLSGVQLVISDAHEGLKAAVAKQLQSAGWQRDDRSLVPRTVARLLDMTADPATRDDVDA